MVRQPAVAGQFYTDEPKRLRGDLQRMVPADGTKRRVLGIVSPHAGYVYSGRVAGAVYGAIAVPGTVIILGPNHHGFGVPAAIYPEGEWVTPLGSVAIDKRLSGLVQQHVPFVEADTSAHRFEHSLEVQVPFLQHCRPDVKIVPLCLGFGDYERCRLLGEGVAKAIGEIGEDVLIVASSDMTHYESADAARAKDDLAIAEVLALHPEELLRICRQNGITMCGVVPTAVMLVAARALGATRAELMRYATSGDVTGDNSQVVAYAAIAVF